MTIVVTWLWQGIVIATLTALTLRSMPRLNAATRHAIWWFALVAVATLPLAHIAVEPASAVARAMQAEAAASVLIVAPAVSPSVVTVAAVIWLVMAVVGAVRIGIGLWTLRALRHTSQPFDPIVERRLPMWVSVCESGRRATLRVSDVRCGACVVGLRRPTILISRRLIAALDYDALDQIVMHEHAHVARFDDWGRLMQAVITTLAGLHPAIHLINRQINIEREAACDDRVVARHGSPRRYATCLADAAAQSVAAPTSLAAAIGSASTLDARVRRLLDPARQHSPRLRRVACTATAILFVAILTISREFGTLVTFEESVPALGGVPASTGIVATVQSPSPAALVKAARPATRGRARIASSGSESRTVNGETPQTIEQQGVVTPALVSNRVDAAHDDPSPPPRVTGATPPTTTPVASGDAPWTHAANAGVAIGSGAKRSGLALGGLFTRAGKAIARSF